MGNKAVLRWLNNAVYNAVTDSSKQNTFAMAYPLEACYWTGCPLLRVTDIKHTPDLAFDAGKGTFDVTWTLPASDWTSMGFHVCTVDVGDTSQFVTNDCAACLQNMTNGSYRIDGPKWL